MWSRGTAVVQLDLSETLVLLVLPGKAMTDSSLTNVWLFAHQKQVLVPAYRIGSRISTNSWGAIVTSYSSLDKQMDSFAYNNKDMIILVAAGNCGDVNSGCTEDVSVGH